MIEQRQTVTMDAQASFITLEVLKARIEELERKLERYTPAYTKR